MYQLLAGTKQKDIAEEFGLSQSQLSITINSPMFKQELEDLEREIKTKYTDTTADVREVFNINAPKAAKKMVDHIDSADESISLRATINVVENSDFGREKDKEIGKPIIISSQQMVLIEEAMVDEPNDPIEVTDGKD